MERRLGDLAADIEVEQEMVTPDYSAFFKTLSPGTSKPHAWQSELAAISECRSRLIQIPTGLGKTLGVAGAWLYHRAARGDNGWPRRLVWCLPMRGLVEQTKAVLDAALESSGLATAIHILMGGVDAGEWALEPEKPAVLIGTQDMLLSRALNRGYGAARARWPIEMGLLSQDALWVMDEVQLMDVGLVTSAQLQAFRTRDAGWPLRPVHTWWMSATLQPSWLQTEDTSEMVADLPISRVTAEERSGPFWTGVQKPCRVESFEDDKAWADRIASEFEENGRGKLTLVVANRVDRARAIHDRLRARLRALLDDDALHLVHGRFRLEERAGWRTRFLRRDGG